MDPRNGTIGNSRDQAHHTGRPTIFKMMMKL